MTVINPSRRALFERFRPTHVESSSGFIRPPQAREELQFLRMCDQCMRCSNACPSNAITQEHGYPVLSGNCDSCYLCVHACPTGALTHSALKAKVDYRCNPKLAQYCKSCSEVCRSKAISVQAGEAAMIDNELCSGCGDCLSACEFFAITLD
ncbi:hypothetical protein BIY21_13975 [Vibrio ponticus]|uniref:4Fe-4S ferredoxin-type domain-containing protein n=1 Tax=Vibrio ponticus TaxID=265668 RepID=A0ABX3FDP1_9VIBR|nr:4Fe-4S binding protein [Vibrio ponticus]OLQ90080.1 hypothetical protein BIY21_13975 [Vibrio ponticus]